jgi:hypothetical protein
VSSSCRRLPTRPAALLQVLQHIGVLGERGEQFAELVQRQVRELLLARGVPERCVERREVLRDLLPGGVHLADAGRHLGRDARRPRTAATGSADSGWR